MTSEQVMKTWTDRYRANPDLAQSIIETLKRDINEADDRIDELEAAVERLHRIARTLVRTGRPLRNFGEWVDAKRELQELEKETKE